MSSFRNPSLVSRDAYGGIPNESQMAADTARRMAPMSPRARMGMQPQVRVNPYNSVDDARQALRAPSSMTAPAPVGPAPSSAPTAPSFRVGSSQSRFSIHDVPKGQPLGANWRVNNPQNFTGSPTANWRLHTSAATPEEGVSSNSATFNFDSPLIPDPTAPRTSTQPMMVATPATAPSYGLRMPSPGRSMHGPALQQYRVALQKKRGVQGGVGIASTAPSGAMDHNQLRQSILGDLNQQIAQAQQAGNREAIYELASQRAALDQGGFAGLSDYRHQSAMNMAQREQVGAKTDVLHAQTHGADPERVAQDLLRRGGSPEEVANARRLAEVAQAHARGGTVNPNHAMDILSQYYPAAAHLFQATPGESPEVGGLPELYHHLQSLNMPGMNDPKSEFAQAAAARIRQMYGSDLPGQLRVPETPSSLVSPTGYLGAVGRNWWNGTGFSLDPWGARNHSKPAVDWFNSISH